METKTMAQLITFQTVWKLIFFSFIYVVLDGISPAILIKSTTGYSYWSSLLLGTLFTSTGIEYQEKFI